MDNNKTVTKKMDITIDGVCFQICYKKALSLWLVAGRTRFFVTCNERDIVAICGLSPESLSEFVVND